MNAYRYTDKDLLQNPEKYSFSKYEGIVFVSAYFENRIKTINYLKEQITQQPIKSLTKWAKTRTKSKNRIKAKYKKNIGTASLLSEILQYQLLSEQNDEKDSTTHFWLSVFIRKYEVFKRIFTKYSPKLKKIGDDYSNLLTYVLLSINLQLYFRQNQNLKFLNTSLKINDMVCSKMKELRSNDEIYLAKVMLETEIDIVRKLYLKKGIKI